MRITAPSLLVAMAASFALHACDGDGATDTASPDSPPDTFDGVKSEPGKEDSSVDAAFVDFEFDGELLTQSAWSVKRHIETQLLYTIGQLNGDKSVGRLDRAQLTNIESTAEGELTRVTYRAVVPVAWGKRNNVPETYELKLPRDVTTAGLEKFTEKYSHDCVDWGAHDVTSGTMWYYYRPDAHGCEVADEDIVKITAAVVPSTTTTTGKFPEYDLVYADDVLRIVAVFGKYEDDATSSGDAGISAYNNFISALRTELKDRDLVTTPAEIPSAPGVNEAYITFEANLGDGKTIEVYALLVDNIRTAGPKFDERYEALSTHADLITYNGHAGLGANIRALARKGHWVAEQYVIVFMNGCDTYAYVDAALWDAHADVNEDDPTGTKYTDIISNAMPSMFRSMPRATMALVRGLMDHEAPVTYEQMFERMDRSQVVLVSGEEDNTYVPGGGDPDEPSVEWSGLEETGSVAKNEEIHFETPVIDAGRYVFEMTGSADSDLYVRIGEAPTSSVYDCRPYKSSSNESCLVDLPAAAPIHVMVRGYAEQSDFALKGRPESR